MGEMLLRQTCPQCMIVRLASLFGKIGVSQSSVNVVDRIIEKERMENSLSVIDDVSMSPTYAYDASRALE